MIAKIYFSNADYPKEILHHELTEYLHKLGYKPRLGRFIDSPRHYLIVEISPNDLHQINMVAAQVGAVVNVAVK